MKLEEKRALSQWSEYHRSMLNDVFTDTSLSQAEVDKLRRNLEADPIRWIQHCFPKYAKYPFSKFHISAILRLIEHDEWYEVLSWSRELAKSTTVMFVLLYLVLTGRKRFVVCASATEDAAIRLLTPLKINLESNSRLRQLYGDQQTLGAWTAGEFTARCGAKFLAIGAGSAPRGLRNEYIRPDVIYTDDFDTDADCKNPEVLKKKWEWWEQALYGTRSISEPLLVVWCGNIIAKDCCIVRAGKLANSWDVVNIRDKNGRSTWPEKNSEEHINRTLSKISKRAAQTEYFNNPLEEGEFFKLLPWGKVPPLHKFKFLVTYGDPAYSDSRSKKSSTKSLWLLGKYKERYYIIKGFLAHETNATFIDWYFQLEQYVGGACPVYHYIENNKLQDPFFQQVFRPLLAEANKRRKMSLHIRADEKKKTDKAARIESRLEPIDREARWVFNEEEQDNPMMLELREQFLLFDLSLPYPADGPDSIEGGIRALDDKLRAFEPTLTIPIDEIRSNNNYRL